VASDSPRRVLGRPAGAAAATTDVAGMRLRDQQQVFGARRAAIAGYVSRYRVEIHKKFSIPAMCIAFVLIGAPLALRFPRGGVGLVIGASAGIFGLYYVGLIGGESLADKQIITPFWAMWTPNLLMTAVGLALFSRLGREHATSRGGSAWPGRLVALLDRWRARRGVR
jgi:lipopolysaccharide export system permease protein